jgi:hypothetical protein
VLKQSKFLLFERTIHSTSARGRALLFMFKRPDIRRRQTWQSDQPGFGWWGSMMLRRLRRTTHDEDQKARG